MEIEASLPAKINFYVKNCHASESSANTADYVPLFSDYECKYDIFDLVFNGRSHGELANPFQFYFHSFVFDNSNSPEDGNLHLVRLF